MGDVEAIVVDEDPGEGRPHPAPLRLMLATAVNPLIGALHRPDEAVADSIARPHVLRLVVEERGD